MFSLLVGATDLDLNFRQIGDKGAMAMAQIILTETTLTSVDLGFNDIGREGIHHIAAALRLNSTVYRIPERSLGGGGEVASTWSQHRRSEAIEISHLQANTV